MCRKHDAYGLEIQREGITKGVYTMPADNRRSTVRAIGKRLGQCLSRGRITSMLPMWDSRMNRPAVAECPSSRHLMPRDKASSTTAAPATTALDTDRGRDYRLCIKQNGFSPDELRKDSFCGRRAMVNKIWCRKVARAWLHEKSEAPHPRIFSQPRYQDYAGLWYLAYRSCVLVLWLSIIVCSIFEFGSHEPLGNNHKWPIYLTNWDLLLGAAQATLGLWLVRKRRKIQRCADFDGSTMTFGKMEKLYWFLYTSTCVIALGVTVSYWCAVHDSKIHHIDALNIMLHVINSFLMIIDILITGIPIRMRNFWWSLVIVKLYLLFTVIYYLAGGLDKRGHPYIYKVLNWQNPGLSILVSLGGLTFLLVVHSLLCLVTRLRERGMKNSDKYSCDDHNTNSEQSPGTIKHVEIV